MTASVVPFLEAVQDVSAGNRKIPQSDFLADGSLAVVDQGQSLVAGYTDTESAAVKADGPVIVFGDHTRAFKYVDFPFAMGADGVKVLRARGGFDPKFVYRYLQSCAIPSAGYSRHFKFLKEISVPRPPLDEQRRIATILDQADAIRAKRRQVLAHLDDLTQSTFHDMFGDLTADGATIDDVADVQGGLQVSSKRANHPVEVPYLRVANAHRGRLDLAELKTLRATESEVNRTSLLSGDLLFVEGHADPQEVGRVAVWSGEVDRCVHQNHLIRGRLDQSRALPTFVATWLNSDRGAAHFRRASKTTSGLNTISTSTVRSAPLPVPSPSQQNEFASRVLKISEQQAGVRRALAADDELYVSLQSRAFRGEL